MSEHQHNWEGCDCMKPSECNCDCHPRPAPSPLPWITTENGILGTEDKQFTIGDIERMNDARFIITAVNSYAAHLALIEELLTHLEWAMWFVLRDNTAHPNDIGVVQDALAKSRALLGGGKK